MLNTFFLRFLLAPLSLRLWLTLLLLGSLPTADLWAQASLDSPTPGSLQSGINLIHGWRCEAAEITLVIDDGAPSCRAVRRQSRGDTAGVCHERRQQRLGRGLSIGIYSIATSWRAYPDPRVGGWRGVCAGDVQRRPPRRRISTGCSWEFPGARLSRTRREYHHSAGTKPCRTL